MKKVGSLSSYFSYGFTSLYSQEQVVGGRHRQPEQGRKGKVGAQHPYPRPGEGTLRVFGELQREVGVSGV